MIRQLVSWIFGRKDKALLFNLRPLGCGIWEADAICPHCAAVTDRIVQTTHGRDGICRCYACKAFFAFSVRKPQERAG